MPASEMKKKDLAFGVRFNLSKRYKVVDSVKETICNEYSITSNIH